MIECSASGCNPELSEFYSAPDLKESLNRDRTKGSFVISGFRDHLKPYYPGIYKI
jgi:hypothetical protein